MSHNEGGPRQIMPPILHIMPVSSDIFFTENEKNKYPDTLTHLQYFCPVSPRIRIQSDQHRFAGSDSFLSCLTIYKLLNFITGFLK